MNRANLVGQRFDKLVVVEYSGSTAAQKAQWLCRCDCGGETVVTTGNLKRPGTHTCGCSHKAIGGYNLSHGMTNTREFNTWRGMLKRCYQPSDISYPRYGGRGISVCDRWRESFSAFFIDMGSPPSATHSLDRINSDGNYEPTNCQWADRKEQARNRRSNRMLTLNGRTQTVAAWAEETNLTSHTISRRLKAGWSVEDSLTKPVRH